MIWQSLLILLTEDQISKSYSNYHHYDWKYSELLSLKDSTSYYYEDEDNKADPVCFGFNHDDFSLPFFLSDVDESFIFLIAVNAPYIDLQKITSNINTKNPRVAPIVIPIHHSIQVMIMSMNPIINHSPQLQHYDSLH
nr:MAG TPA: hypothetical protein [Caudoviricetes sp.]